MKCPHCGKPVALRKASAPKQRDETRNHEIRALSKLGATDTEIADAYGITRQRVHQIRRQRP